MFRCPPPPLDCGAYRGRDRQMLALYRRHGKPQVPSASGALLTLRLDDGVSVSVNSPFHELLVPSCAAAQRRPRQPAAAQRVCRGVQPARDRGRCHLFRRPGRGRLPFASPCLLVLQLHALLGAQSCDPASATGEPHIATGVVSTDTGSSASLQCFHGSAGSHIMFHGPSAVATFRCVIALPCWYLIAFGRHSIPAPVSPRMSAGSVPCSSVLAAAAGATCGRYVVVSATPCNISAPLPAGVRQLPSAADDAAVRSAAHRPWSSNQRCVAATGCISADPCSAMPRAIRNVPSTQKVSRSIG